MGLRAATQDVRERLPSPRRVRGHQGCQHWLGGLPGLVARLYGFYTAFEVAAAVEPVRSAGLGGVGPGAHSPCSSQVPDVPRLVTANLGLGRSTWPKDRRWGGRDLARGLDRLVGKDVTEG